MSLEYHHLSQESQQHFGAQFHQIFPINTLLRLYIAIHKYDVVCLSETYLNTSISSDDDSYEVPGSNLFRTDHPSNTKRGGVCIYYRNSLALKILSIHYLQECINLR